MGIESHVCQLFKGVVEPKHAGQKLFFAIIRTAIKESSSKSKVQRNTARLYLKSGRFQRDANMIGLDTEFAENIFQKHFDWYRVDIHHPVR